MVEWTHPHLKDKTLEQKIEALGALQAGEVGSPVFEMYRMAINAELAETVSAPRKWAIAAAIFAGISAAAAVAIAVAAF